MCLRADAAMLCVRRSVERRRVMRWQQMAIGVLAGLASTLGSLAWLTWDAQREHRQVLQSVRAGMTAAEVRATLGPPRTVWTGPAPLQAALQAEGMPLEPRTPSG